MNDVRSPGESAESIQESISSQEWKENLNVQMICPECRESPPNLIENYSTGDTVCASCGLVLADRQIDEHAEWRTFAEDESSSGDPSRVGSAANPLYGGPQLETSISFGDGSRRDRELRRAHANLSNDNANKQLKDAYEQISVFCQAMHLPEDTISVAKAIFKSLPAKTFGGKNQPYTIAGCIFIAAKNTNHERTFKEISEATGVSKSTIRKVEEDIIAFRREQDPQRDNNSTFAAASIGDDFKNAADNNLAALCERYCNRLLLDRLPTRVAVDLARKVSQNGTLAGRSPLSAATGCIYMASFLMGQPKTPKEIALIARISDATIRTAYRLLYAEKDSLIEQKWLHDGGDLSRLPEP